ncbi:PilZ domain-containing protein [Novosphingobium sp. Gsoil 351]|uniref:PilZ domain-containing protein n=1 Tax=Novosphingobium sp. Gsoil 351 TaxID=2675225 RepID=UPI0012B481CF|nr:PilZ domain-containing protein [Novosphingobium sp. Gsoil 351]QGN56122.1 hypothetical protein GKE62_17790 [Novosphingobium sp. Gsoil 351]
MHFNAVLQVGASEGLSGAERPARRAASRRSLTLSAISRSQSQGELPVIVRDISPMGFLIEAETEALSQGEVIGIELPGAGTVIARVVWANHRYFGCSLDEEISPGTISAALLKADARGHQGEPTAATREMVFAPRAGAIRLGPELNFSVAFRLTVLFWTLIGSVIYFVLN